MQVHFDLKGVNEFRRALNKYGRETELEINKAMTRSMHAIESKAKQRVPVRTGRLRSSIRAINGYLVKTVFTNVFYAPFVEFGTKFMAARPYLFPAWEEERPKLINTISRILRGRRL